MTNKEAIEELKKVDTLDMPARLCEAHYMAIKSLEQDPKTGHWIDDKCSVCGKGIEDLIDSREWYRNEEPNFCPFCGIKMQEVEE